MTLDEVVFTVLYVWAPAVFLVYLGYYHIELKKGLLKFWSGWMASGARIVFTFFEGPFMMWRANVAARKSNDPKRKVGAVLYKNSFRSGYFLTEGYNNLNDAARLLSDAELKTLLEGSNKAFMMEHAEEMALRVAEWENRDVRGASMAVNYIPCVNCATALVEVGISKIFLSKNEDLSRESKWKESKREALRRFNCGGVEVVWV